MFVNTIMGDKCTETAAKIKAKSKNQNQQPRLAMTEASLNQNRKHQLKRKLKQILTNERE